GALFQPMSADDVATAVTRAAAGAPVNGVVETGGPEKFPLDQLVRRRLEQLGDHREIVTDPNALYSGARIDDTTLVPGRGASLGQTTSKAGAAQSAATSKGSAKAAAKVN